MSPGTDDVTQLIPRLGGRLVGKGGEHRHILWVPEGERTPFRYRCLRPAERMPRRVAELHRRILA